MTTVSQNVNDQTSGTSLREHVQANTTCCLLPTNPSFPSVNLVYFSRGQPFTCLPAMVASKHPIRVSGLERIQRGLPIKSPLAPLRPREDHPWHIIFVVPKFTTEFQREGWELGWQDDTVCARSVGSRGLFLVMIRWDCAAEPTVTLRFCSVRTSGE
jgi:hypothetical protein